MDSPDPVDDEFRTMELIDKYRQRLVAQAKATLLARPGVRIAGVILDRSMPQVQALVAAEPPTEEPAAPEIVAIVPRAWALDFVEHFTAAASEWFPSDGREGDQYRLPVVLAFPDEVQTCVVTWSASP